MRSIHKYMLLASAALAGLCFAIPHTKPYKKWRASQVLEETQQKFAMLEKAVSETQSIIDGARALMIYGSEKDAQYEGISDTRAKLVKLRTELQTQMELFKHQQFDTVRVNLHPTFGLSDGKRETLADRIENEKVRLRSVSEYCEKRKQLRDEVWDHELYNKARLRKPADPSLAESLDDGGIIPVDLWAYVPKLTKDLEDKLGPLGQELNNSMGKNLIDHQPKLEHILQKGKTDRVKQKTQTLYDAAMRTYKSVKAKNDGIERYRPSMDGSYSMEDHERLRNQQQEVVSLIKQGDKLLSQLYDLHEELHKQYFVFVSGHRKTHKTFSHSKLVPDVHYDADGELVVGTKQKSYSTDGYRFFYVVRTVTPDGEREEEVYVGEKDSENSLFYSSWDYGREQEVGWVIEWKQLHNDNEDKKNGLVEHLSPFIEQE
ncbi:hypothetical protein HY486_01960 [Candidatus Woesearchaeota archaeon]|nr:hypothetical protein [Candidatus Woesearchaeota archaeon]